MSHLVKVIHFVSFIVCIKHILYLTLRICLIKVIHILSFIVCIKHILYLTLRICLI